MIEMEKMKIGDKIRAPLFPRERSREFEEGTVVFIHPRKRFFIAFSPISTKSAISGRFFV